MMSNTKFELKGSKEVMAALKAFPADIQSKLLKGFLRKVGKKFIVDELKANLNYSQKSENSIQVVAGSKNELKVSAGITRGGYKLRWADLGTKVRQTKKGSNRGQIIGKNQIQPLLEKQVAPIVKYVNDEMANEINKSLERRLKKINKI